MKCVFGNVVMALCTWHVLERAARQLLLGLVGLDASATICSIVWRLVRRGGHLRYGSALMMLKDGVHQIYNALGNPDIPHRFRALSPASVVERLENGKEVWI